MDTDVAGPGINETACLTEIRGQDEVPDDELVPISVQNVQIFELDQNLKVVAQTVRAGSFVSGSNFTYTSIISTMAGTLNPTSLPRGLQLVITGLNKNEETVVNTYIILYTNDCGIFPILTEGQTAGWTIFVSFSFLLLVLVYFFTFFPGFAHLGSVFAHNTLLSCFDPLPRVTWVIHPHQFVL